MEKKPSVRMPRTIQSFYDLSHIVAIKFFNDFNGYVGVPEHGEKNMWHFQLPHPYHPIISYRNNSIVESL